MTDAAIALDTLTHRYGGALALDGVSLTLPRAASIAFIGPDGVGKSTLLSIVAGVRRIQDGGVQVLGQDMRQPAARHALSSRIAFMPQGLGHNLYPTMSVQENLEFFARLYSLPAAERRQRMQRLLRATALAPFADRFGKEHATFDYQAFKQQQYDLLADHVRKYLDMERLYEIMKG